MKKGQPPSPVPENIHQVLKTLREKRIEQGLTQIVVADAVGYSKAEVARIERQARNIYFQRLVDYADFLGFDLVLVPKKTS
jgi:transcriptional regulator with XRE-family HTH domain